MFRPQAIFFSATFVAIFSISSVHGFTAGAPPLKSVCRDMVPQHHEYKPQITASPYVISANRDTVAGGSTITIRINSTDTTKVRGFYIQARDSETNMPIGTFTASPNVGSHSCNGKRMNAATHTNGNLLKEYVDIEWQAPLDYEGEVLILGTVLRDFVTYWSGIYAEPVSITKKSRLTFRQEQQQQPFGNLLASVNAYFQQVRGIFGGLLKNISNLGNSRNRN